MRLERLHEYITSTVALLLGIGFALWSGSLTGHGQIKVVGIALGSALMVFVLLKMRTRLWLLMLLFWPVSGQLVGVPSHPPVKDLVIAFVFGGFLLFKALKLVKTKPAYGLLDVILLANVLYIVSVFFRNPTGTESLGMERVGGRPYIELIFALLAYWVVVRVRINRAETKTLPYYFIGGNLINGMIGFITYTFPSTVPLIGRFYSGIDTESVNLGRDEEMERAQYLLNPSASVFSLLCARYLPTTLFNPLYFFRFGLTLLCVLLALKSGHRIAIISLGVSFATALYFRKGVSALAWSAVFALPALAILLFLQGNFIQLPLVAQRALSFLPAKWDAKAADEAEGSTEWRIDMWKRALTGDKYIQNKWLGDGFGFTRRQLQEMADSTDVQENFLISGDFHSGPVSTIRFVGYLGLALFYLLLFALLWKAWSLINRSKGTPFFVPVLLIAGPSIVTPFFFTFIFGAYQNDILGAVLQVSLFNMLSNSMEADRQAVALPAATPAPGQAGRLPLKPGFARPNLIS